MFNVIRAYYLELTSLTSEPVGDVLLREFGVQISGSSPVAGLGWAGRSDKMAVTHNFQSNSVIFPPLLTRSKCADMAIYEFGKILCNTITESGPLLPGVHSSSLCVGYPGQINACIVVSEQPGGDISWDYFKRGQRGRT